MTDSRPATLEHIAQVQRLIYRLVNRLLERAKLHDWSKLESPEVEVFDEFTPRLRELTYGSVEYEAALAAMGPALRHHYAVSRHHPEHFEHGIEDMTLVDLVEMLCDWKAATLRHADGDVMKSLETSRRRFGISDQVYRILVNTLDELE